MRTVLALALVALLAGCSASDKKDDRPPRPVRFAVIGAPEVGANDDDLAAAIGKLSREPDLDFVLVPGPVLAKDADATSLELLQNDLGQLAPPVYVSFAAVGSASGASTLKAEDILAALEKMGPGEEHAVAYTRSPPRAPNVLVDVLSPDGKSKLDDSGEPSAEGTFVIALGALKRRDLCVVLGEEPAARIDLAPIMSGYVGEAVPALYVPRLARGKVFLRCTLYPRRLEVEPIALDRSNPAPLSQEIADPRVH